jgi:hypothetical protein
MTDPARPDREETGPDSEGQEVDCFEANFEGKLPDYLRSTKPSRVRLSALDLERVEEQA